MVVEIPRGGRAKFEIDPATGTVWLDRVLSTATQYPAEYGYIDGTSGQDGDALDAVLIVEEATVPGCHVRARPIGVLMMADENGPDSKVLCIALGDPSIDLYRDITDVTTHLRDEIEHFFRIYKELEPHKTVTVDGWRNAQAAERLIVEARSRYTSNNRTKEGLMQLDLDAEDSELLRELLDHAYRELRYEISNTDNSVFKHQLRERETRLKSLLDQAGGPLPDQR